MKFTDSGGRKIETRSGVDVTAYDGFPQVELYIDNKFIDALAMIEYNSKNVSDVETCLFEYYEIEY